MRYKTTLYKDCDEFTVHKFKNREDWLKRREKGIGGSDASTVIGLNPWKTNEQLYKEKLKIEEPKPITNLKAINFGINSEEHIRKIFQYQHEDKYEVHYLDNTIIQNNNDLFLLYSPDGLLIEKATGKKGILEAKTTTILNSMQREKWKDKVPDNYFIQTLHGLLATGFDFVVLVALIIFNDEYSQIKTFRFDRVDHINDLEYLLDKERYFWSENIQKQNPPNLIINI